MFWWSIIRRFTLTYSYKNNILNINAVFENHLFGTIFNCWQWLHSKPVSHLQIKYTSKLCDAFEPRDFIERCQNSSKIFLKIFFPLRVHSSPIIQWAFNEDNLASPFYDSRHSITHFHEFCQLRKVVFYLDDHDTPFLFPLHFDHYHYPPSKPASSALHLAFDNPDANMNTWYLMFPPCE